MDWDNKSVLTADVFRVRLARALKIFRMNAGYTQQQIADILVIQRSTYTYYELGKTSLSPHQLHILLRLYQTDYDTMMAEGLRETAGGKKRIRL